MQKRRLKHRDSHFRYFSRRRRTKGGVRPDELTEGTVLSCATLEASSEELLELDSINADEEAPDDGRADDGTSEIGLTAWSS